MNFFLIKIIYYLVGFAILNVVVFVIVSRYYYEPYENVPIPSDSEILILADSHGLPLEQKLAEYKVYNFSSASDSYYDMFRKLKYAFKHMELKKVIISADDHTLSLYRDKYNNANRSIKFVDFNDADLILKNNYELFKEKYLQRIIPLFNPKTTVIVKNYFKSIFTHKKKRQTNWKLNKNKRTVARKRAELQFDGLESSKKMIVCVKSIVELCKDRDIEIVAIKFPLSRDYLIETEDKNYGADDLFRSLGIEIYDFKEIFIGYDEYFANQDHLNNKGGELFSEELIKMLK